MTMVKSGLKGLSEIYYAGPRSATLAQEHWFKLTLVQRLVFAELRVWQVMPQLTGDIETVLV